MNSVSRIASSLRCTSTVIESLGEAGRKRASASALPLLSAVGATVDGADDEGVVRFPVPYKWGRR